jgi:hypothetical protein
MYKKNHMNSRLWPQFIRQYACAKCFLPTGIFGIVYIENKGGNIRIMNNVHKMLQKGKRKIEQHISNDFS